MAQSLSKILLHIVFSVKDREPLIIDSVKPDLHAYIAASCRKISGGEAFRVGGTEDHVHIACALTRSISPADLIRKIKVSSSAWLKKQPGIPEDFAWQAGYGVFSLGHSQLSTLIRYIENQHEHHLKKNFQNEFIDFLKRYQINYDEHYLWD